MFPLRRRVLARALWARLSADDLPAEVTGLAARLRLVERVEDGGSTRVSRCAAARVVRLQTRES